MERKLKNFRFNENTLKELEELVMILSTTETEAIARAIHFYLAFLKNEEDFVKQKAVIPLQEYQAMQEKLQSQLTQALYRIGELEGITKEREERIKDLKDEIEHLRSKGSWWHFWKR